MVDAPGAADDQEEADHTVDVDGPPDHIPIEAVEIIDENPGNNEATPAIGEGDGLIVKSSVISTTYQAGNEVGKMNGVNDTEMADADESATEDETSAFMRELETFYRERGMEFKHPKFYQEPLDCLKLWRAVIPLGGYERVTAAKLWRQVGEAFNPPKTCTTVSWTFRIFYEKALLDYEKHKREIGELEPAETNYSESNMGDSEQTAQKTLGSGRARRDQQLVLCKPGIVNMAVLQTLESQL